MKVQSFSDLAMRQLLAMHGIIVILQKERQYMVLSPRGSCLLSSIRSPSLKASMVLAMECIITSHTSQENVSWLICAPARNH